jgi:TonB family protein
MGNAEHRLGWEGRAVDGRFALLERLGGSLRSDVFLTVRQGIQKAAIKLIPAADAQAEAYLSLWEEAKTLSHPHLVRIFETGRCLLDDTNLIYVVTELAENDLGRKIAEGALNAPAVRDIFNPILDALSYLHAAGVVHGHVKPSNFLEVEEGWKLTVDAFLDVNGVREPVPLPGVYDAPEIADGIVAAAADTWSVGITLTEALTQQLPVRNPESGKVELPALLPALLSEVVRECLRADPADRCSTREIRAELAAIAPPAVPPAPTAGSVAAEPVGSPTTRVEPAPDVFPAKPEGLAAEIEPDSFSPVGRTGYSRERFAPPAASTLFTQAEDDRESRSPRFPLIPVLIGLVVLAAFVGILVARNNGFSFSLPIGTQNTPAVTQPASPSPAPAASSGPSTSPPAPAGVAPQPEPAAAASPGSTQEQNPTSSAGASPAPSSVAPPAQTPTPRPSTSEPAASKQAGENAKEPPRPLNARGAVSERVLPNVSPNARVSMHGPVEVILRVTVNRDGRVEDASYVSPGEGNYFARVSQRAAQEWKFDPPEHNGHPEPSVWRLRFYFSRRTTEVTATEEVR